MTASRRDRARHGGATDPPGLVGAAVVAVLAEVENVGPGTTRELVVNVPPGTYVGSCVPGMSGDGFRTSLTVTADARFADVQTVPTRIARRRASRPAPS